MGLQGILAERRAPRVDKGVLAGTDGFPKGRQGTDEHPLERTISAAAPNSSSKFSMNAISSYGCYNPARCVFRC